MFLRTHIFLSDFTLVMRFGRKTSNRGRYLKSYLKIITRILSGEMLLYCKGMLRNNGEFTEYYTQMNAQIIYYILV
jgi:hypothetical protein